MQDPIKTASRRQVISAAGIGALVFALFTPQKAKANDALADAYRNQIKVLRKAKRKARRISIAKARQLAIRNYNRAIGTARRNLRQALRDC